MAVHTIRSTIRSHTPSACDVGLQALAYGRSGHHARQSSHRVPVGVRLIATASGSRLAAEPAMSRSGVWAHCLGSPIGVV
jgi:hypothetical protein